MPPSIVITTPTKGLCLFLLGAVIASTIGRTCGVSVPAQDGRPECAASYGSGGGGDGDGDDGACTVRHDGNGKDNGKDKDISDDVGCTVYMAPSTIGNHSNLGIYAAAPFKYGDTVPFPEIVIPMVWRIFGVHPERALTDGELWDRYIWEQHVGGIEAFDDLHRGTVRASVFVPGVGCTVNSMLDLSNINSAHGSQFDEAGAGRDVSPGAGAFSPYHSSPTTVSAPDGVAAGQELFASYGDEWIPWIPDVAVTFDENFYKADDLMDDLEEWIVRHGGGTGSGSGAGGELTDELLEAMWKFMVNFPHPSRPLSVLPKEWSRERLQRKQKQASPPSSSPPPFDSPSKEYWAAKGRVSVEFLKEHGRCQDHIRPGISTLPHAGRGAFATRDLPRGTVVGHAPLVHVAVRGEDIFRVTYNHSATNRPDAGANNYTRPDLVVNYSFGHRNSTLHLTPYGAMVNYINHGGTGDGANVRVEWPSNEMVAHKPEWLTKDISFLRDTIDKIGLSFDYVATRDIREGEEVLMDYGDEWVQAWEEHVKNWVPPEGANDYVHSTQFLVDFLRTPEELETDPYPWNLHTLCTDSYRKGPGGDAYTYVKPATTTEDRVHCRVLERHQVPSSDRARVGTNDIGPESYVYSVELTILEQETGEKKVIVHNYPRRDNGINLYDKAYSQSWHLENAFRHKMYIPDDIMPPSWLNV